MEKGCNTCKNYKDGQICINKPPILRSCIIGKTEEMEQWWKENGHKKIHDNVTQMECFEETELGKKIDEFIRLLDEFNKLSKE